MRDVCIIKDTTEGPGHTGYRRVTCRRIVDVITKEDVIQPWFTGREQLGEARACAKGCGFNVVSEDE